ncbi:uncharacterized protein V6R79_020548 [Siganus canaliculatus]
MAAVCSPQSKEQGDPDADETAAAMSSPYRKSLQEIHTGRSSSTLRSKLQEHKSTLLDRLCGSCSF